MNPRSCLLIVLLVCIASCNGSDQNAPAASGFHPAYGYWTFVEESVVSNECPGPASISRDGELSIDERAGGFQVTPGYGDSFSCKLDAEKFVCDAYETDPIRWPRTNARSRVFIETWGEFSNDRTARGRQKARLVCEGDDCNRGELSGVFPCSLEIEWVARAA